MYQFQCKMTQSKAYFYEKVLNYTCNKIRKSEDGGDIFRFLPDATRGYLLLYAHGTAVCRYFPGIGIIYCSLSCICLSFPLDGINLRAIWCMLAVLCHIYVAYTSVVLRESAYYACAVHMFCSIDPDWKIMFGNMEIVV